MPNLESAEEQLQRDEVTLTVPASKRLIGLGVAASSWVQRALQEGTIGIARGTTNGYVAEAILGREIDRTAFVTGTTLPEGVTMGDFRGDRQMDEIVIERGIVVAGKTLAEAARTMGPADVLIKGANALNYRQQIAGILINHPAGGTIGGIIGHVMGRRITLIIPVGLEREIAGDIVDANRALERHKEPPLSLWPVTGIIITEIEALAILTGVEGIQIGAGGVAGAEGSVRLLIEGTSEQMEAATDLLERIVGEPSFAEIAQKAQEMRGRRG